MKLLIIGAISFAIIALVCLYYNVDILVFACSILSGACVGVAICESENDKYDKRRNNQ